MRVGRPLPVLPTSEGQSRGLIETAQTFLTIPEVGSLVGDYLTGASVNEPAERCGVHRAAVFSHLRRCDTLRHNRRLDVDDSAEAVRPFRAGVSMSAISRRLGGRTQCSSSCTRRDEPDENIVSILETNDLCVRIQA